ncbi:SLAM family member 9 [Sebastes umbrosus]|uniref:SLAM family member 9 n=1 Tax=Sebastes umbrosus TaxID=72105 RepID=UPI00189F0A80|nr:SLAM family member 9 [Sebastes umbrosus]
MKKMLLILILQVALVESLTEVSGYPGDTIILHSGADPSWKLSSIEWSIFSNNTWIATHRNSKTIIERVDRYKGRLELNISSGDLTIKNLAKEDSMEYTVHFTNTKRQNSGNKTKLTVRQRLQKPTLNKTYKSEEGGCRLWLLCSSTDNGVDVSWQGEAPGVTVFNKLNPDGNSAILKAFLKTTQDSANFTCTSSKNTEKASTNVTLKCDDDKPQPPDPDNQYRRRDGLIYVFSMMFLLSFFIIPFYREV